MGELAVEIRGGRTLALRLRSASESLEPRMDRALGGRLGPALEAIYARAAPRRSGRLAREIDHRKLGPALEIYSPVRDPRSGFPYTGVTRFGHAVAYIYPRRGGALGPLDIPGGPRFAARVRGYRPTHDWADDAFPAAEAALAEVGREILDETVEML